MSPGYALVHESVAEEFVAAAKVALIEMFGKNPKSNPDYSRIISAREVDRLAGLIDPAKEMDLQDPEVANLYLALVNAAHVERFVTDRGVVLVIPRAAGLDA